MGHLVVGGLNESKLDVEKNGIEVLTAPSVRKIAMVNSKYAPFVEAGTADVGIFALASARRDKGGYWTVPLDGDSLSAQGQQIDIADWLPVQLRRWSQDPRAVDLKADSKSSESLPVQVHPALLG